MKLFLKIFTTILIVASLVFVGGWILCLAGFGGGIFFLVLIIIPIIIAGFSLKGLGRKQERQKQEGDIYFLSNHNNTNIQLISYIINAQKDGLEEFKIVENLVTEGGGEEDEIKNIMDKIKKQN